MHCIIAQECNTFYPVATAKAAGGEGGGANMFCLCISKVEKILREDKAQSSLDENIHIQNIPKATFFFWKNIPEGHRSTNVDFQTQRVKPLNASVYVPHAKKTYLRYLNLVLRTFCGHTLILFFCCWKPIFSLKR